MNKEKNAVETLGKCEDIRIRLEPEQRLRIEQISRISQRSGLTPAEVEEVLRKARESLVPLTKSNLIMSYSR